MGKVTEKEMDMAAEIFAKCIKMVDTDDLSHLDQETAITFLSKIIDHVDPIGKLYSSLNMELDRQKQDLEHKAYDEVIRLGYTADQQKFTRDAMNDAIVIRRSIKDALTVNRMVLTNLINFRSFIRAMDNRTYTPKSEMYQDIGIIRTDPVGTTDEYKTHLKEVFEQMVELVNAKTEREEDLPIKKGTNRSSVQTMSINRKSSKQGQTRLSMNHHNEGEVI